MTITFEDGTCRGNNAAQVDDIVRTTGDTTIGCIAKEMGRSVRYIRSIADECDDLRIEKRGRTRVSDWFVRVRCHSCNDFVYAATNCTWCGARIYY
jgi:hypothetical protein